MEIVAVTAVLTNTTVSGNLGGGMYKSYGHLSLTHSTVTGNRAAIGGGLFSRVNDQATFGTTTLNHSLVSGNFASDRGAGIAAHSADPIAADDFNLLGRDDLTSAQAFYGFTPGPTDISATSDGSDPTPLTDLLDPTLRNNGGLNRTHALATGSPALDAVADAVVRRSP